MNKCVRNNCRKYFNKANYKEEVTKGGNHAQFCSYGKQSGHKVDSLRSSDKICFTVYGNEMVKEESWAPFLQSVVIFGRCHLVESGEKTTKLLKEGMWDLVTCANGEPNVVPVAFKDVPDDGKLVVGDVFLETTLNNSNKTFKTQIIYVMKISL